MTQDQEREALAQPASVPAEPAVSHSALAGMILTHMGYSTSPSLEPGADERRDRLAEKLAGWLAAAPAAPQPVTYHLGACITDGKLQATVMRCEADKTITVVATAEIDAASLYDRDCIASMKLAAPSAQAPQPEAQPQWQPIESAPKETEVLIGRWIDGKFKWGRSELFYEQANEFEGETFSGWVWAVDYCDDSVAEAPTHWMPLPAAPSAQAERAGQPVQAPAVQDGKEQP